MINRENYRSYASLEYERIFTVFALYIVVYAYINDTTSRDTLQLENIKNIYVDK